MTPDPDFIIAPEKTTALSVALEPALNALNSLLVLEKATELSGFAPWVAETLAALSPQRRQRNTLVTIGLHYALPPTRGGLSFPAYLEALAAEDPVVLRDRLLARLSEVVVESAAAEGRQMALPTLDELVASREGYLNFLDASGLDYDPDIESEAHDYMTNPPVMQALIVEHLRAMWDEVLAAEWQRVEPMLQESVSAFRQVDYSGLTPHEVVRAITGQDLSAKWGDMLDRHEQVVFVPSAHVGPYMGKLHNEQTLWVFFGARMPEGVQAASPDLSRSELLVRLSALADDTRLRILALILREGELCAQDIITRLDLSQSAASRHLRQLSATGYLTERRRDGAKCYSLNPDRVEDTLQALSHYLLK